MGRISGRIQGMEEVWFVGGSVLSAVCRVHGSRPENGVLFTSEGIREREIDRGMGTALAVMRMRSSDNQEGLKLEPLLLYIDRSQLRWFRHLSTMASGRHPGGMFQACPTRRAQGRPRAHCLGTPWYYPEGAGGGSW